MGLVATGDTNLSFLFILFTKFLDYLVLHKEGKNGMETEDNFHRVRKKSCPIAQILQMMKWLLTQI